MVSQNLAPKSDPKTGPKIGPSLLNCHPVLLQNASVAISRFKNSTVGPLSSKTKFSLVLIQRVLSSLGLGCAVGLPEPHGLETSFPTSFRATFCYRICAARPISRAYAPFSLLKAQRGQKLVALKGRSKLNK